jgi:hypothetical protein
LSTDGTWPHEGGHIWEEKPRLLDSISISANSGHL